MHLLVLGIHRVFRQRLQMLPAAQRAEPADAGAVMHRKVAAVALLIRVLTGPFGGLFAEWQQIVFLLAVASMLLGAFGAIAQTNIKRLMAYSSIGHVGYILVGLAAGHT